MKGKWKVTSQYIGGTMMYAIYRQLDTKAVDHSGNREYAGGYIEDKATCVSGAEFLNRREEKGKGGQT